MSDCRPLRHYWTDCQTARVLVPFAILGHPFPVLTGEGRVVVSTPASRTEPGGAGMAAVRVNIPGASYTVQIAPGALDLVGEIAPPPGTGQSAAVIADETTAELFGGRVTDALKRAGWRPHPAIVPPGEDSKQLATAGWLYEELTEARVDRDSTVFALGGGVVGDLAGFVAATYLRGISLVLLPTTLLAQVDSCVGGKVAVDLPRAKNLVGAFHQPRAVVADPEVLRSLSQRQFSAGMAEVVKHAAIADRGLFDELERHAEELLGLDISRLTDVVATNCRIKASIVTRDPEERAGIRAVLNYGHTIGHAIERAAAGWQVLHGEAVAVGMVAEAQAATALGLSHPGTSGRLARLLGRLELPISLPSDHVDAELAEAALRSDKKVIRGHLVSPVVPEIGTVELTDRLPIEGLITAMQDVLS